MPVPREPPSVLRVANRVLLPVLTSPLGARLGRRLAVVDYVGHRSGRRHRLVTQYVLDGRTFRIRVSMPERKTWWRNFTVDRPLQVRLAGCEHAATAHVVRDGDRVVVIGELVDDREGGIPGHGHPDPPAAARTVGEAVDPRT